MADVFVSYANDDRTEARCLASALQATGLSVWWDRDILIGADFRATIEREIDAAGCVVVLWSQHSTRSTWVLAEADRAEARGVLLPAFIEQVRPPMGFEGRQTADLAAPERLTRGPEFDMLVRSIGRHVTASPDNHRPKDVEPSGRRPSLAIMATATGIAVLTVVLLYSWAFRQPATPRQDPLSVAMTEPTAKSEPPTIDPPPTPTETPSSPAQSPRINRVPKRPTPAFCAAHQDSGAEKILGEASYHLTNDRSPQALESFVCAYQQLPENLREQLALNPANTKWLDEAFDTHSRTLEDANRIAEELGRMLVPIRATLREKRLREGG